MSRLLKLGLLITGRKDASVSNAVGSAVGDQRRLGRAVESVQGKMASAREARKYGRILNELKRKQRSLDGSSERLERGIAEVERRYESARRAAKYYADDVDRAADKTERLGRSTGAVSKREAGLGIVAVGGAALTAAGYTSMQDQSAITKLGRVSSGGRQGASRSMRAARDYARQSDNQSSAGELVRIEYELGSSGLDEELARETAKIVEKVSLVTEGAGEDVAKTLGRVFELMGEGLEGTASERASRVGNLLTQAQFQYAISDFNQLGSGLDEVMGSAAAMKVPLDQTVAVIGQLNNAGQDGSKAGTAMGAVLRNLVKAGDDLGFSMVRAENGQMDLVQTLSLLDASLDGLDLDARATKIQELFGEEGAKGLNPLLQKLDDMKAGLAELRKEAGKDVVGRSYADAVADNAAVLAQFKESLRQVLGGLGDGFMPVLGAVVKGATGVLNVVASIMDNVPGAKFLIGTLAGAVVAVGGAMAVATTATWAWNAAMSVSTNRAMIGVLGRLNTAFMAVATKGLPAAIAGVRALSVAMFTNPIGLAVGAIAVAGFAIFKMWKPIKAFFGGLWSEIGPPITAVWEGFKRFLGLTPIGLAFKAVGKAIGAVKSVIGGIIGFFKPVDDGLEEASDAGAKFGRVLKAIVKWSPVGLLKRVWSGIGGIVGGAARGARGFLKKGWIGLKATLSWNPDGLLGRVWSGIGGIVGGAADLAKGALDRSWQGLKRTLGWSPMDTLRKVWSGVTDFVSRQVERISKSVRRLGGFLKRVFGFGGGEDEAKERVGRTVRAVNDNAPEVARRGSTVANDNPPAPPPAPRPAQREVVEVAAERVSGPSMTSERIVERVVERGGDTYEFHIHGVTEPEAVARRVKQILAREARGRSHAALFDSEAS